MPTATVTSKGQITIPKAIRDSLGVHPGDRVQFWRNEAGQVVVEAATLDLRSLHGLLEGAGPRLTIEEMNAVIAAAAAGANG